MTRSISATLGIAILVAGTARADVIVPNGAAGVEADGTFALTTTTATGRTYQFVIDDAQLTGLVGQAITGLQWRLNGTAAAAWPPANANYAFWDVFVGPGVDPAAMSTTFASNFSGAPTQVRSGPHSYTAGSHTNGSSPNAFGPSLLFSSAYTYTGGDLTIEMRFAAQAGTATTPSFDATLASGGPGNGWGVAFAGRWVGDATGTNGTNVANFLATNLVTQVIPEPSSVALVGITLAGAAYRGWRRRRHAE